MAVAAPAADPARALVTHDGAAAGRLFAALISRNVIWLILCLVFASLAMPTFPASGAEPGPKATAARSVRLLMFDLPEQPLADALRAFSRITQMQVLYDSNLRSARRSSAVRGIFSPEQAMQILLVGTGLVTNYTAAHDVVLTQMTPPGEASSPMPRPVAEATLSLDTLHVLAPPLPVAQGDAQAERRYAGTVQAEILQALKRDPATQGGSYRVLARIWIDAGGIILRISLGRSTGDPKRDAAIEHGLKGLALSQPPRGLQQPMGIVLTAF